MKRLIPILAGCFAALSVQAQSTLQQYISQAAGEGALAGTPVSIMVRDMAGNVMASHSPDTRLTPASNTKLITTGCALHAFGPDYRFKTGLGYSGCIENGTLEGDLYIVGGGDPTIGSADSVAYRPEALFWKWKTLLRQAGIERIHGRIIGDGSAYEGHLEHASWNYDDVGTYYAAGSNALCFYENAIDYDVAAGPEAGSPVQFTQVYPETPWMSTLNYGVTGPRGTGNSLYLYTTDLAPYAQLRGTFALGRRPKTEHFANKYGDLTCAYYFWKNLKETGWEVTGGYARVNRNGHISGADESREEPAAKPVLMGSTESPKISDIARLTNWRSDNFYAESFLRAMGEAATRSACYDSCRVAIYDVLEDLGLSTGSIQLADGSGLSRNNYISARWMTDYLLAMRKSPAFGAFLSSLPAPGEGTLSVARLSRKGERVRMKSGSMDGVLCYSGYILGPDGAPRYCFSLLTNNAIAPVGEVRTALMGIVEFLLSL